MGLTPRRNPRCPKCRSRDLTLLESWNRVLPFHVCEDGLIRRDWSVPDDQLSGQVEARCRRCAHRWWLRGIYQVGVYVGMNHDYTETCSCKDHVAPDGS